jgi:hypothetical protein
LTPGEAERFQQRPDGKGTAERPVAILSSDGLVLAMNVAKADCVRRPAATAPMAKPPSSPTRTATVT